MSYVCANCFQDKIARQFIRKRGTLGDCDFCDSRHRKVLEAFKLNGIFEEVLSLYQPYDGPPGEEFPGGDSLAECLEEWAIFDEDLEEREQNDILDEIRRFDSRNGDPESCELWQSKSDHWTRNPLDQRWPWFADHIKRSRRHIFEDDPSGEIVRPETWVPDLLEKSSAILHLKLGKRLFRGRIGSVVGPPPRSHRQPLPPELMGAPPAKLAKGARVNPEGISFLYCALEPETAIVETGRFPGAEVSLRLIRTQKVLRIADLRYPKSVLEPLDTTDLSDKIQSRTLLASLGDALGEPIHPEDSNVEYIPTQYLAEVILSAGYDGICYPSALNPRGTNVVLFNPESIRVSRRGWVFDLGPAKYTIHPEPREIFERRRSR